MCGTLTTGSNNPRNIQPLVIHYQGGQIAVAHNGNLTNALAIRKRLEADGSIFKRLWIPRLL